MKPIIGCRISPGNYTPACFLNVMALNREFVWDAVTPEQRKVIVLSDACVYEIDKYLEVPKRVAWLMESPAMFETVGQHQTIMKFVFANLQKFDKVLSCDKRLVQKCNSSRIVYQINGTPQVAPHETKVYNKSKFCSLVASDKNYFPGHTLRHEIIRKFPKVVTPLGGGYSPFERKVSGYADYMFSIAVENCKVDGHLTDQILDPIACGTVPVYWGTPSICDLFDPKGIIRFDDIQELEQILATLTQEDYWSRLPSIKENLRLLNERYRIAEYSMWEGVLAELYE